MSICVSIHVVSLILVNKVFISNFIFAFSQKTFLKGLQTENKKDIFGYHLGSNKTNKSIPNNSSTMHCLVKCLPRFPYYAIFQRYAFRDHAQITTTKLVAFGLGNPPVSFLCNGEQTRPGSLAHVIHDQCF